MSLTENVSIAVQERRGPARPAYYSSGTERSGRSIARRFDGGPGGTDDKVLFQRSWQAMDRDDVQPNTGRFVVSARENQKIVDPFVPRRWRKTHPRESGIFLCLVSVSDVSSDAIKTLSEPRAAFKPPLRLAERIRLSYPSLSEDEKEALAELEGVPTDPFEATSFLAERIGEEMEGLMAGLARAAALVPENTVQMTVNRRFTRSVSLDLVFRLALDPHRAGPILDDLCREFLSFVAAGPRDRWWGSARFDRGEVTLAIDVTSALEYPDPGKADPNLGVESK